MSKSKNHKWQKNWRVDPEDSSALHITGVRFHFEWDRQGVCHQTLKPSPVGEMYIKDRKEAMSTLDFQNHMDKLSREARRVFFTKEEQENQYQ